MDVGEKILSAEIKNGTLSGTYLLWGDEDYLKKTKTDEMRLSVVGDDPAVVSMNSYSIFYGDKDCDFGELIDAFLAPPFLCDRKFIHVSFVSLDDLKDKKLDEFFEVISEYSSDETVVAVTVYKDGVAASGKNSFFQIYTKQLENIKCVALPLNDNRTLTAWVKKHFLANGLNIDERVASMITDVCGREMWLLKGEIDKCSAFVAAEGRKEITADDVLSCMSKSEHEDAFSFVNAIASGNTAEALYYLQLRARKKEDPIYVMGEISRTFSNLCLVRAYLDEGKNAADIENEAKMNIKLVYKYIAAARNTDKDFFENIMDLCSDADRLVKLGGDYMPLERLVCLATRRGR